jgi:hypothetical protein
MSITAHPSDKSRHFSKEILALLSEKGNKVLKLPQRSFKAFAGFGWMVVG